ncbi:hypothetical protein JMA_41410 (plasmid) [Jeotgalibacillus malaysiensis]|uniref:Thioredoxin domain-containing protein n=1 Tax=Jeotgalibacillus malaysiensis TaxID=1508404 RepID=A0A0B5AY60_9BACL|nr:TlpA disulfide reductase family protein [Jeotgalibacillus malaysiensis]AJD93458.1 hypothetical protein JMA_41410 [Jeotgalibacillus malaysiensis]
MKQNKRTKQTKKWAVAGLLGAVMITGVACSNEPKEQAPGADEPVQIAKTDEKKEVEKEEVQLKEVSVEVDYSKSAQEILTAYSEEGMSRFKLSYPDTYSMEYALKTIGREMPKFEGKDLNGKTITSDDYKNKSYIVNISKSTCEVCQELAPVIQTLEKGEDKIPVINLYPIDKSEDVKAHREKTKWSKDSIAIVGDKNKSIENLAIKELAVATVPTLLFVDKSGKISYINIGLTDDVLLSDMKEKAFGEEKLYDFVRKEMVKVDKDGNVVKQEPLIDESKDDKKVTKPVEPKKE